jgi:hypothetical protein
MKFVSHWKPYISHAKLAVWTFWLAIYDFLSLVNFYVLMFRSCCVAIEIREYESYALANNHEVISIYYFRIYIPETGRFRNWKFLRGLTMKRNILSILSPAYANPIFLEVLWSMGRQRIVIVSSAKPLISSL